MVKQCNSADTNIVNKVQARYDILCVFVQDFIDNRGYPSWMTVTRVLDGAETPLFEQYFADWDDDEEYVPMPDQEVSGSNVAGRRTLN